jgi:hypothetical protein
MSRYLPNGSYKHKQMPCWYLPYHLPWSIVEVSLAICIIRDLCPFWESIPGASLFISRSKDFKDYAERAVVPLSATCRTRW